MVEIELDVRGLMLLFFFGSFLGMVVIEKGPNLTDGYVWKSKNKLKEENQTCKVLIGFYQNNRSPPRILL